MNSYGISQLTYYIYAPDHCHDIGVWTSWRSPVTHIRVIRVYSFPFNVIHLYTFTNAFLKIQNIKIKELYHTNNIQWYPKFTGISSFWMLVISCGRRAGYMLALSRQWHADLLLVLKLVQGFEFECWNEPEVLSNMNWPWRMQLMCLKLYPNNLCTAS